MSEVGRVALCLFEALIEHLEAEGVASPETVDAIYDDALIRLQDQSHSHQMERTDVLVLAPAVRPPAEAPKELIELFKWWEANAKSGLPDRSLLDAAEVGRYLSGSTLLEIDGGDFRFRAVGEELRTRYGALDGQRVGDVLAGCAKEEIVREHRVCASARRPTLMRRSKPATDGSDEFRYWRLLLPFGARGCTVELLSTMQFDRYH